MNFSGHSPAPSERSDREGADAEEDDDEDEDDDDDDEEEATEAEPEGFSDDSIIHVSFDNGKDDSKMNLTQKKIIIISISFLQSFVTMAQYVFIFKHQLDLSTVN